MATPFTATADSATISTTEYFLVGDGTSASYQTTAGKLRFVLDLSDMIAGDQFRIRVYDKINGGSATMIYEAYVEGVQAGLWNSPEIWVKEGWEISLKRTAGTDATVGWSIKVDVGDTNTASMSADVVTASAVADGAIDAGAIADGAIDAATFATDAKDLLGFIRRNTAQTGSTATTIKLDASASAVDGIYVGAMVMIVGGTGVGQFARITAYNGTTKVATVETAYANAEWVTVPDNTSVFLILAWTGGGSLDPADIADAVWDALRADHVAAGSFGEYVHAPSRWQSA